MDKEMMKKMMGMNTSGAGSTYKLDKITMSGDDGAFKYTDLMTEREKGSRPQVDDIGKKLQGVILKMRWQLSLYREEGSLNSSEYDNKWTDEVTVYPMKDKGAVSAMKEKYGLRTLRIVYLYIPSKKKVVRLVVKTSALTADNNPNGELGLFEYINECGNDDVLPCQFITEMEGVFRKGLNKDGTENRRKDHYAMTFKRGRELNETEFEKITALMVEVNEKTGTPETEVAPAPTPTADEAEEITPDDIPF